MKRATHDLVSASAICLAFTFLCAISVAYSSAQAASGCGVCRPTTINVTAAATTCAAIDPETPVGAAASWVFDSVTSACGCNGGVVTESVTVVTGGCTQLPAGATPDITGLGFPIDANNDFLNNPTLGTHTDTISICIPAAAVPGLPVGTCEDKWTQTLSICGHAIQVLEIVIRITKSQSGEISSTVTRTPTSTTPPPAFASSLGDQTFAPGQTKPVEFQFFNRVNSQVSPDWSVSGHGTTFTPNPTSGGETVAACTILDQPLSVKCNQPGNKTATLTTTGPASSDPGTWMCKSPVTESVSGNVRFQIGGGLPMPIGPAPAPDGKVVQIAGARIRVHPLHAATSPATVLIDPTQFAFNGPPMNLPVFNSNPNVFQVRTDITFRWPQQAVVFREDGRTGASTVTFCGKPGSTVTANGNPGCAGGVAGTGLLRYKRTSHQFGGPAQSSVGGAASVALRGGAAAPCAGPPSCVVAFFDAGPASTGAVGAAFGPNNYFTNRTVPTAPSPGAFFGSVGAGGTVLALGTVLGPGLTNGGTSWGGPWTTGMVTASAPSALPPEKFTLSGADSRVSGAGSGSLSLVAGGFSQRSISGPNANRGWLNLVVGAGHVPMLPANGVAALAALTALSGAYALRRHRRRQ